MTAEQFYLKWANESFGLYPDRKPAEYSIHFAESYANHRLNEEAVRLESSLKLVRAEAAAQLAEKEREIERLENKCDLMIRQDREEVWYWADDAEDHPESLACPALIKPDVVRRLVAAEQRLQEAQADLKADDLDMSLIACEIGSCDATREDIVKRIRALRQREVELEHLREQKLIDRPEGS